MSRAIVEQNQQVNQLSQGNSEFSGQLIEDLLTQDGITDVALKECIRQSSLLINRDRKDLSALYHLDCSYKPVKRLDGLSVFPNLSSLTLVGSQVTDITPIQTIQSLNYLDITGLKLSDIEPVFLLSNLKTLKWPDVSEIPCSKLRQVADGSNIKLTSAGNKSAWNECWGSVSNRTRNELSALKSKEVAKEYFSTDEWDYYQALKEEYELNKTFKDWR